MVLRFGSIGPLGLVGFGYAMLSLNCKNSRRGLLILAMSSVASPHTSSVLTKPAQLLITHQVAVARLHDEAYVVLVVTLFFIYFFQKK